MDGVEGRANGANANANTSGEWTCYTVVSMSQPHPEMVYSGANAAATNTIRMATYPTAADTHGVLAKTLRNSPFSWVLCPEQLLFLSNGDRSSLSLPVGPVQSSQLVPLTARIRQPHQVRPIVGRRDQADSSEA